ncbi:MAG: FAD-dependent oxidoreductase [Oscillospiraceae bacterium]|nr:FAD-dependent oxidoreductase [Oscillospiraceae bacterium]
MAKIYQADFVVIGGGAAGMPAALEAVEQGIPSVILMDKRPFPGGNARMAGGYVFAADAYTHEKAGVTLHGEDVYKELIRFHHYDGVNPRQLRAFIDSSADNLAWLRTKGIEYEFNPVMGNSIVGAGAPGSYARVLDQMKKELVEKGGVVLTNTPATELLLDESGAIRGVKGVDKDGDEVLIETKAVFLSPGGFMGNDALMALYFSDQYDPADYVTDALRFTGDGVSMAEQVGAKLAPKATLCKESGFSFAHQNAPHRISMYANAVWVNRDGVRFCDESTAHEHTNANLLVAQPGMCGYSMMDETMMQDLIQHPSPQVSNEFLQPGDPKVRGQLEKMAQKLPDQCLIAQSLEEIAAWIGCDADTFRSTIVDYNSYCANGKDEEFLKPGDRMMPLTTEPYYVCKFFPLMVETIGPVVVNHHFQVIRAADNRPIPGLYAGGAVTAGWTGHDYEMWGGNLGYGLASGRLAADHVAAQYKRDAK